MGTEIVAQVGEMAGMRISVVVDVTLERALGAYAVSRRAASPEVTNDLSDAARAVQEGRCIATTDFRAATSLPSLDAVIDATGDPEMGAVAALEAIEHHRHIVMMNVECDVTVGPILACRARRAGVVYSLASGDEPAAIIELCRFARALGLRIVAAGKGKNNPLDVSATPYACRELAAQRRMSPRMLVEFIDGSKTSVEMAAVSNATGLVPDVPGMHGPRASRADLLSVFCLRSQGGILAREGVVDYAIGDVHPGVFVIVTTDNPTIRAGLVQRDMGPGPNYLLFRPYHLCSIEVPLTVCRAVFYGESSGHPRAQATAECVAVAKRDLEKGEVLDGIGEYCYRGSIEGRESACAHRALPLGLARGCVTRKAIPAGAVITLEMVDAAPRSVLHRLREAAG